MISIEHQLGQDRRLVARTGAELQHHITRLDLEKVGHEGDDQRLRDRLAVADGHRPVGIGFPAPVLGHEEMARQDAHGLQYPFIDLSGAEFGFQVPGVALDHLDHSLPPLGMVVLRLDGPGA
jgi:hypothetical protein